MDPRLLKRPSSTRCNCWNGSAQEVREWITLQTAQLEAVVQGTMTQGQARSSVSLVGTKLVTKQNTFSGEQGGKERWSFKMRAYCAAHVTKLYYILSVLMDDKALDAGRTCPVRDGVKSWRSTVTCLEARGRALQAILVLKWNILSTDVTQLLTVWTDEVKDYEQQNSNKTFGGFSGSWNPRTHDECDLMAAEIQAAAVFQVCGERGQSAKDCWYHAIKGSEKVQRKGTRTKDDDDKRKGVCNNCDGSGDSASNCLRERRVTQCKLLRWR